MVEKICGVMVSINNIASRKIHLQGHSTQIFKGVERLNLVKALFLVSVEALLNRKIVPMGPENVAQNCNHTTRIKRLIQKPLGLAGEVIGI